MLQLERYCIYFRTTQENLWVSLILSPFLMGRWFFSSDDHRVKEMKTASGIGMLIIMTFGLSSCFVVGWIA